MEDESSWPAFEVHPKALDCLLAEIKGGFAHEESCESACCAPVVEAVAEPVKPAEAPANSMPVVTQKPAVVAGGPPVTETGASPEQAPAAGFAGGSGTTQIEVRFEGVRTSGNANELAAIPKALAA